jgi:hypothetical protein
MEVNMPTLREAARITARGKDIPDVSSGEVKPNAWLLWSAVHTHAEREGAPPATFAEANDMATKDVSISGITADGDEGFIWRGVVNKAFVELWPMAPRVFDDGSAEGRATQSARRMLNQYLRMTGNLICLVRGNKDSPSSWWVRGEWYDGMPAPALSKTGPAMEPTRTEKRLTAHEAGEDREPKPVSVSKMNLHSNEVGTIPCLACDLMFANETRRNAHYLSMHKTSREFILEAMADLAKTQAVVSLQQIWQQAHDAHGYPASAETLRKSLYDIFMEEDSPLVHVTEYGNNAIWTALAGTPIPPADLSHRFKCREPSCPRNLGWPTPYARSYHENLMHPTSEYRYWHCSICGAEMYDKPSLTTHISKKHGLRTGTPTYATEVANAEAKAMELAEADGLSAHGRAYQRPPFEPRPLPQIVGRPMAPERPISASRPVQPAPEPEQPASREGQDVTRAEFDAAAAEVHEAVAAAIHAAEEVVTAIDPVAMLQSIIDENARLKADLQTSDSLADELEAVTAERDKLKARLARIVRDLQEG